jgi:hypothetical protein
LCYHATTVIAEAEKSRRLMRLGRQKEKKKLNSQLERTPEQNQRISLNCNVVPLERRKCLPGVG